MKPTLKILGHDRNAFYVLGAAQKVAKENNMDWDKIHKEATNGDYDHLLQTMMEHFEVE